MRTLLTLLGSGSLTLWLGASYWNAHLAGQPSETEVLGPIRGEMLDPLAGLEPAPAPTASPVASVPAPSTPDPLAAGAPSEPAPELDPKLLAGLGARQLDHVPLGELELNAPELEPGVKLLTFQDLYLPDYTGEPDFDAEVRPTTEDIFPPEILALDGQRVALDGFMQPLDFKGRQVIAFVLSPLPPGCCFGAIPRMDEYLEATVIDESGIPYYGARPIRAIGTLEVGEALDEYGYVTSIYRLDVERVDKLW
jgi:hypothetical protein